MSPFTQIPFQLIPGGTLAFKVMEVLDGGGGFKFFMFISKFFALENFNKNFFGCVI